MEFNMNTGQNSGNPSYGDHHHHPVNSIDVISVELRNLSHTMNTALTEIKQDLKLLDKHEADIVTLQHIQKAQQESILNLSKSIDKLSEAVSTVSKQFTDLSLKFFTGIAWIGGGAAVIAFVWSLLSSGLLKFGSGGA